MTEFDWNSRNSLHDKISKNTSKFWAQHLGACAASLSAFSVGNSLGWSSPAKTHYIKGLAGFKLNEEENSLVGSLLTIGAAFSCLPAGYITDNIGRKSTLLCSVPISLLGWGLIIWARSAHVLYAGRFLLGISMGIICVTAPVYKAEICEKTIRGTVGSYFQLFLASGILFVYIIGSNLQILWFSAICGVVPLLFGLSFVFFPETPVYYLKKGRQEEAQKSMKFFLLDEDTKLELYELTEDLEKDYRREAFWNVFWSRPGIKSLLMSISLMMFQQFCGVNAFIFNATDIFEHANSSLNAKYETIIIGAMQVIGTLFATFLVDSLGRVLLLSCSALFMAVCTFFLGLFFYFQENHFDINDFSYLPLISLCAFIIAFAVGYGAIPWLLMPELIPPQIKGTGVSMACVTNWLSAFIVTKFFFELTYILGRGFTFWIFSVISVLATVFSFTVLPETKAKSFEEIQEQLAR